MAQPTIISLFSGAGGLDYGFEAAGFRTAVALEMDHACCETLRANKRAWPVLERDIFDVSSEELLKTAGLKAGQPDLLIGGPPCQPFSKAGYWARGDAQRLDDPRSNTLSAYLRVLEETKPRAFLLENVEGLAYRGKDEGLQLLLGEIEKINRRAKTKYRVSYQVLNASDYGVPQQRKRLIMIGARDGSAFRFPLPGEQPGVEESQLRLFGEPLQRNAWDAIGDLASVDPSENVEVTGRWADLLPSIPEGKNYLFHTDRGEGIELFGWRCRFWTFLLKLAKDQPSWTIQAQPGPASGPFHWNNRRLSMRELCRLQTFPDDVHILGNRLSVQKQVGNAVPSLLAEILGRQIRTELLGLDPIREPLTLLPPKRTPVPPAEKPGRVPARFKPRRHKAHPGTGEGPGARQRAAEEAALQAQRGRSSDRSTRQSAEERALPVVAQPRARKSAGPARQRVAAEARRSA